jgi:predicted DNA-binding mobile mystery protein A
MDKYTYLKVSQLDRKLKDFSNTEIPQSGWINVVRNTLNITFSYIAKKLNTSPQVIKKFEQNEVEGTITINTLKKVADAMECDLVYAFVPKAGSFENLIDNRAEQISDSLISRASNSMDLEMQNVSEEEIISQKMNFKNELKQNLKKLWKYEI